MTKYRVTIEEVREDGTVTPLLMNDGSPIGLPDSEGLVVIGIDDADDSVDVHTFLHEVSVMGVADALHGHPVLKKAATLAALRAALERKFSEEGGDNASD